MAPLPCLDTETRTQLRHCAREDHKTRRQGTAGPKQKGSDDLGPTIAHLLGDGEVSSQPRLRHGSCNRANLHANVIFSTTHQDGCKTCKRAVIKE